MEKVWVVTADDRKVGCWSVVHSNELAALRYVCEEIVFEEWSRTTRSFNYPELTKEVCEGIIKEYEADEWPDTFFTIEEQVVHDV